MGKINPKIELKPDGTGFSSGVNYYFYTQSLQNPLLYQQILSNAKTQIDIWDPYYNKDAAHVFDQIEQENITINILTHSYRNQYETDRDIKEFKDEIKSVLSKRIDHFHINIKCNYKNSGAIAWHDRYLIIDNHDAYLVGTSIEEQIRSTKSFGIYQITEEEDRDLIIASKTNCFNSCNAQNSMTTSCDK